MMSVLEFTIKQKGVFFKTYDIYLNRKKIYSSSGSRLITLTDQKGKEVIAIKKTSALRPNKFEIIRNGSVDAEVEKEDFQDFSQLTISGVVGLYFIEGGYEDGNYLIENAKSAIAKIISKRPHAKRFVVGIKEGEDIAFIIALVIGIHFYFQ